MCTMYHQQKNLLYYKYEIRRKPNEEFEILADIQKTERERERERETGA